VNAEFHRDDAGRLYMLVMPDTATESTMLVDVAAQLGIEIEQHTYPIRGYIRCKETP
jgi:hypothetical protein